MIFSSKPAADDSSVSSTDASDDESQPCEHEHVEILGELVGATDLNADDEDIGTPRPYAEVYFGGRKIHYSEPAEGLSPIWTIDTDSLFLLKSTEFDLANNSLTIKLFSSRNIGPLTEIKTFMGQFHLSGAEILKRCDSERFEVALHDELGEDSIHRGNLALRLRMATPADAKFVKLWNSRRLKEHTILKALLKHEDCSWEKKKAVLTTERNETRVAGASFLDAIGSAFTVSNFLDSKSGTKKTRVKPYSDPKRPKSTQYLSPHEVKVETRRTSENWVQAGSGKLGRLHVEVLSCHDLPNVDVGEAIGNVTDSFVALVYEDALAETPVINDELSPHWMPWTQRAFCFGMMHPASMLYLGVFDYDIGPLANHEPLGRVAVNISNLQRDTLYTLRYNLFKSSNVTDRTPNGQITIRLRVEIFDEKVALMTAIKPRPNIHINVKKNKTFKVVRYTCFGEYDGEDKFDLTVIRSYINEIFEYKRCLSYTICDSLYSLMFWRGQVEIFSIFLPIHSMIFFCVTTSLIERPHMFPAFAILSVAWVMIASGRMRRQHPSPWHRCPTFFHYLDILLYGKSKQKIHKISSNEGREEAIAYEEAWQKREAHDMKKAEARAEMERVLQEHGDESIHTQVQLGIPLDLLERLGRYQGYIGSVCRFLRQAKIILLWEESILSFWISAVLLGAGLISLLLPWAFILTWTSRFVIYGLFGPHMKVVDLWLRANKSDELEQIMAAFDAKKQIARIRREQALKIRAVKCLRFGKLITQVPAFNLARHYDRPLPASTAKIIRKSPVIEFASILPGQQLYGDMIPRLEEIYRQNATAVLCRMEKLASMQARILMIQAAAKLSGGLRRRQLRLKKCSHDETTPHEAGYEVVQVAGKSTAQLLSPTETQLTSPTITEYDPTCLRLDDMNLCTSTIVESSNPPNDNPGCLVHTEYQPSEGSSSDSSSYDEYKDKHTECSLFSSLSTNDLIAEDTNILSFDDVQLEPFGECEQGIEIVMLEVVHEFDECHAINQDLQLKSSLSPLYRESDSTFITFYRA